MKVANPREIAETLQRAKVVAIFGHVNPDSDCYGGAIGLKIALNNLHKKTYVYLPDELPYNLAFLSSFANFNEEKDERDVDIVVVLDSSSFKRVHSGEVLKIYKDKGIPVILVDHHLGSDLLGFADFTWHNENISSVSEMVLAIIKEMRVDIHKEIATFLLAGIEGDTSSFQNQNTTKDTFEDAAFLMSKGARFRSIIDNTINSKKNINLIKLYGTVLERVVYNKAYKTVTTYITLQDLQKYELDEEGSYSEIINYLNAINGVKMIVLITERENGELKVSLRTRDENVNVQTLASALGGGGHAKASGFSLNGRVEVRGGKIKITCS